MTRVTVDADLLLNEVQRNQRSFRATIFWRDFREVVVAILLIPLWFYLGAKNSPPWTWYLTVPVLVWIAGFMLAYRMRHRPHANEPGEPVVQFAKRSLTEVEDQIWLLRNIFWWYLLPPGLSIFAFFAHVSWLSAIQSNDWLAAFVFATFLFAFLFGLYGFIYYLNQRAVDAQLEPRRQELLTLLTSLGDETISEPGGDYPTNERAERAASSAHFVRLLFVSGLCAVALAALCAAAFFAGQRTEYAKRAPYAAIRWEGDKPVVKIGDDWFALVSLDGTPAEDIVSFSRRTYANIWRKRFEEDLVEVLSRMAHKPKDTVRLVVRPLGSQATRTLEGVPMTEANRRAIYDAARARERSEKPLSKKSAPPDDAEATLRKLIDGLPEQ